MQIVFLDKATLGQDITTNQFRRFGEVVEYPSTSADEVASRISDADVVVINKVKLNATNLSNATNLKLICITATGFDNVDLVFCKKAGIAVFQAKKIKKMQILFHISKKDIEKAFAKQGGSRLC